MESCKGLFPNSRAPLHPPHHPPTTPTKDRPYSACRIHCRLLSAAVITFVPTGLRLPEYTLTLAPKKRPYPQAAIPLPNSCLSPIPSRLPAVKSTIAAGSFPLVILRTHLQLAIYHLDPTPPNILILPGLSLPATSKACDSWGCW